MPDAYTGPATVRLVGGPQDWMQDPAYRVTTPVLPYVYEPWDGVNPPNYVDPFPVGTRLRLRRDGGEVVGVVKETEAYPPDVVQLHTGIVVALPGWKVIEASLPPCGAWDPKSRVQCTRKAGHGGRRHWYDHEDEDEDLVTWLVGEEAGGCTEPADAP